jgi:hypothetical protein
LDRNFRNKVDFNQEVCIQGEIYFWGIYDKIETHKIMVYTLGDNRKVETTFVANGNQTDIITIFDADSQNPVEMQQQGWQMILNNFKKYTENES